MRAFAYSALASRVRFGPGAIQDTAAEMGALDLDPAMLIASPSAKAAADALAAALGQRLVARHDEVRQHVPESLATEAARAATAAGAGCIVAIGGGSAIGLAKAVAVSTGAVVVAVPTTYSGSEMTPIYGLTGEHKRTGRDKRALPELVVYDPELTLGVPVTVTATSAMNALAHCIEALYVPSANPVTSLLAVEGIKVVRRSLPAVVATPTDLAARSDLLYGAHLAGTALGTTGTALQHKLSHTIGGSYDLVHSDVHAVLLPHVAAYNAPAAPDQLAQVAGALGGPGDPALVGGLLHDLATEVGAPTRLDQIGMPEIGLDSIARRVAAELHGSNPQPVSETSLRTLLQQAFEGHRP